MQLLNAEREHGRVAVLGIEPPTLEFGNSSEELGRGPAVETDERIELATERAVAEV